MDILPKKLKLTSILSDVSPNTYFVAVILGIISGLAFSLVIPLVLYAIQPQQFTSESLLDKEYGYFNSPTAQLAVIFLFNCLFILIVKSLSSTLTNYLANRAAVKLRLRLYDRVTRVPIERLERIGQSRLVSMFNVDITEVMMGAMVVPNMWVSGVTVIGILVYLIYLDWNVFKFVFLCIAVAIVGYQLLILVAQRFLRRSRDAFDHVQEGIRGLIYGMKELRLNRRRQDDFVSEELHGNENAAFKHFVAGTSIMALTDSYGDLIAFVVIGIVAFQLPYIYDLERAELIAIVMVLLYITGPVSMLLNNMPNITRAKVAIAKINDLCREMIAEPDACADDKVDFPSSWNFITLNGVGFNYESLGKDKGFGVSSVNLTFKAGQITYIVGGNGSGKSTLSKVISLHYIADKGQISFGETAINDSNRHHARQFIAAIYSDFYLFSKIYGLDSDKYSLAKNYLKYMKLENKVEIKNSAFSTLALSDGQRRRLALLVALLEDRYVYVFDEWAADQDPEFKQFFYQHILQHLKERNKIVIVITHDDRYFDVADQLVTMENGRVVDVRSDDCAGSEQLEGHHEATARQV